MSRILKKRIMKNTDKFEYLVRWADINGEEQDDTREPIEHLHDAKGKVEAFTKKNPIRSKKRKPTPEPESDE